jgi:hypothetical protein
MSQHRWTVLLGAESSRSPLGCLPRFVAVVVAVVVVVVVAVVVGRR